MTPEHPQPAADRSPPAFVCSGLGRTYREGRAAVREALAPTDLTIERGSVVALLGPNGSGKSTLLRILAGTLAPTAGTVARFGTTLPREGARRLGVVFQSPALDPLLTVRENLRAAAAIQGVPRDEAEHRVRSAAEEFSIADRLDTRVARLSGGLQRRADLARALLHDPEAILLDEPSTGLDPEARHALLEAILARRQRHGTTVVLATHLLDEAEPADRVVLLSSGAIVADGAPDALRRALGGRRIELRGDAATIARARTFLDGVLVREIRGGLLAFVPDAAAAAGLVGRLVGLDADVRLGPPTLGDVYLAHAGRSLDQDEAAPSRDAGRRRPNARGAAA